jgi:PAS domain S-box-containing protein
MIRTRTSRGGYLLAVTALATIALLYVLAGPREVDSDIRYFGFASAVLLCAYFAGVRAGLLATAVASAANAYLLLSANAPANSGDTSARLILFVGEALLLVFVGGMIHSAPTDTDRPLAPRYLPAILLTLGATGLKLLWWSALEQEFPFAFFYTATAASAWIGGFGPGLMATMLATVSARYFFIAPIHSLAVASPIEAARVSLFAVEGIALSFLTAQLPEARRLANEAKDQMKHYGQRLWKGSEDARALRAISRDVTWEWNLPPISSVRLDDTQNFDRAGAEADFNLWIHQIHSKDRLKVLASLRSAIERGNSEWTFEYRKLSPGKGYAHVSDHAYIIRDNAWNPIRVVGRSAEMDEGGADQGFQSEGSYRMLFENNPHATLLADKDLQIIAANEAACDLLGYRKNQIIALTLDHLFRGNALEILRRQRQDDTLPVTFEEDCARAIGEVFRARVSAAMVAGLGKSHADRIITIEEVAEPDTNFRPSQ